MLEVAIIILLLPPLATIIVIIMGSVDLYKTRKRVDEMFEKITGYVQVSEPYSDDTPITLKGEDYGCIVYVDGKRLGILPKYVYEDSSWVLYPSTVYSQEELEAYRKRFKTFGDIRKYVKYFAGPFDRDERAGYFD